MKQRIGQLFWKSKEVDAVFRADHFEEMGLHPHVAELIHSLRPKKLLDFGCGDGPLLPLLDPDIEIGLYDPNLASARVAEAKSRSTTTRVHPDILSIKQAYYDVVLLSFVLVCLANEAEFSSILLAIHSSLRVGGTLIVVDGHPCFRDKRFVGHHVEYPAAHPFNYIERFHKFKVCLHGETEEVKFYDYHWTLSDIFNTIARNGMKITAFHEVPDSNFIGKQRAQRNPYFPPYMITVATKSSL